MNFVVFLFNFNWLGFILGSLVAGLLLALGHLVPRSREALKLSERLADKPGYIAINEWGLLIRYTYGTLSLMIGLSIFFLLSDMLPLIVPFIGVAVVAGLVRLGFGWWIADRAEKNRTESQLERYNHDHPELA